MERKARLGGFVVAVMCLLLLNGMLAWGQTKKPIRFMKLTDLTGPASAQVGPMGWAAEDYINWLNKNEGGIDGHPVELELIDTKYDLTLIRSAYARFKGMKQATLDLDSLSGGIEALRQQYDKDKIPVMMETGHGPALYPAAWTFGLMPPYDDVLCAFADWIKKQWKEARKPRIALFLGDYASGRSP